MLEYWYIERGVLPSFTPWGTGSTADLKKQTNMTSAVAKEKESYLQAYCFKIKRINCLQYFEAKLQCHFVALPCLLFFSREASQPRSQGPLSTSSRKEERGPGEVESNHNVYLPTFSEIKAWDFYPGSAGIFEDDTIISEDSRRSTRASEDVRSLPKTSESGNSPRISQSQS